MYGIWQGWSRIFSEEMPKRVFIGFVDGKIFFLQCGVWARKPGFLKERFLS